MCHIARTVLGSLLVSALLLFNLTCYAKVNQVRVVNDTTKPVYIHIGGFAPSTKILPGKWKIFTYPFETTPPNTQLKRKVSLLVATAGGNWVTSPNGVTSLKDAKMILCLDYGTDELLKKSGNRKWVIKETGGFDKGCEVKSYKQPWYSKDSSEE